ncbi:hypothetical protein ACFY7V_24345 [[Kitasatospora] papulosa]|jgi:hypothetical protein|uniref:hypothetical protein n=1 Tax=[Kitasatospora] papulosa TaxID=1464011 RepID=UPI0036984378
MTWSTATLFVLALFGFAGLCITLTVIFLKQVSDLIKAWRNVRKAIRGRGRRDRRTRGGD